ncbi:MAG: DUF4469 domain-containing protein [Bacteroidetes bacterium]|nr:DUF4469 domain-containing protein [Bacteroidales bacterium]NJO68987.1 DUF4469 domain-containing protein [Bacteroidota bacterium]
MNVLHKVKAYLYENFLTDNPNDYLARVSSERTLNVNDICSVAVTRGGASTTAAAMEHNVNLFLKEMAYQMCDGYAVNTGYFTATTLIKGVFDSKTEKFDPKKHSVLFQFNQGELLRNEIPTIEVEIMGLAEVGSFIGLVTDIKTGTINELLTPGRNLKINGSKLKLAGENPAVGIYFINQATNEATKVDTSDIVTNSPSELMILIPALAAGSYKLEVVTQYAVSSLLKEPRKTDFEKVLTVV